jgi:hypothetical protein
MQVNGSTQARLPSNGSTGQVELVAWPTNVIGLTVHLEHIGGLKGEAQGDHEQEP